MGGYSSKDARKSGQLGDRLLERSRPIAEAKGLSLVTICLSCQLGAKQVRYLAATLKCRTLARLSVEAKGEGEREEEIGKGAQTNNEPILVQN